ncbi:hypothetical protein [Deinococcus ruber]|uniref:Uncharacterized protein n=1 Tax=Deinococcus ruber TaxID=1848197 RepID=A0A918BVH9_9DEIO|nr:hypothetical protein [Deinococcus ruber]GGQ92551.1 hypothetical protein GCM10008957_00600 [Deinococcus ruber]
MQGIDSDLEKLQERLIADRKVRALAAVGSYGTDQQWRGSVPTLLSFERGLLSEHSELRAGILHLRQPYEKLESWRDWDTAQAEAPLATLAAARVLYDPTGNLGRIQKLMGGLSETRRALYREELLSKAQERLDAARTALGRGQGIPEQLLALVTARDVALKQLYPALLSHLHVWPEFELRLPHAWRAVAGLRFPKSVYGLERLYAFGGEDEARRCLLATRGLGMVEQERHARQAHQAGYYDGAVRLLRDEAARLHRPDLERWTALSAARRDKLSTLIGIERSPLGPTALKIAQELLEDVREER